jgi:hypothetical protein
MSLMKGSNFQIEMVCNNFPRVDEEVEDIHQVFIDMVGKGERIWAKDQRKLDSKYSEQQHRLQDAEGDLLGKYLPKVDRSQILAMKYPPYHLLTDIYILRVEWIMKCECGKTICPNAILHRTHRTAP